MPRKPRRTPSKSATSDGNGTTSHEDDKNTSLRGLPEIKALLKKLEDESERFEVGADITNELREALVVRPLLPNILNHQKLSNVRKAQRALIELESRLDTCLKIQDQARQRLRLFSRLEFEVKQSLFRVDFINSKSSKPSVEQAISIVVPELISLKDEWKGLEQLCRDVHKRVSDAKETIKIVMKLDDNYRWANAE